MEKANDAFDSGNHALLQKFIGKHSGINLPRLVNSVMLVLSPVGPPMPSTEKECAESIAARLRTPRHGDAMSFARLAERCPGSHRYAYLVRALIGYLEHYWCAFYNAPRNGYHGVYHIDEWRFDHEKESGGIIIGGNSHVPALGFQDVDGSEAFWYYHHQFPKLTSAQRAGSVSATRSEPTPFTISPLSAQHQERAANAPAPGSLYYDRHSSNCSSSEHCNRPTHRQHSS